MKLSRAGWWLRRGVACGRRGCARRRHRPTHAIWHPGRRRGAEHAQASVSTTPVCPLLAPGWLACPSESGAHGSSGGCPSVHEAPPRDLGLGGRARALVGRPRPGGVAATRTRPRRGASCPAHQAEPTIPPNGRSERFDLAATPRRKSDPVPSEAPSNNPIPSPSLNRRRRHRRSSRAEYQSHQSVASRGRRSRRVRSCPSPRFSARPPTGAAISGHSSTHASSQARTRRSQPRRSCDPIPKIPEQTEESPEAYKALVDRLLADGWEATGRGSTWFSGFFVKRRP